jgi:hypothetical protein
VSELPQYEVRAYRPGDEHGILEAFNRIFAQVDPNFVPRTLAHWRWEYLENPSGLRIYLCITAEGRVLAQYAGLPQRIRIEGEPTYFSQSVDSLGDPEFRRGLAKVPLFVQAGKAYDENYGGVGPAKDTLMWGLPVPAAWRIGKKQLKYEYLRTQNKLVLPAATHVGLAAHGGLGAHGVEIEERSDFPAELDAWATEFSARYACVAVRDKAQLDWRYARHPQHRYRIALARRGGAVVGYAVYRFGHFDGADDGLVCDWYAPIEDAPVRDALLGWLCRATQADRAERLVALFPDTGPEWMIAQDLGFRVRPTRYFLVGWSFSRKHSLRWLWQHWYYTLGDTDLC